MILFSLLSLAQAGELSVTASLGKDRAEVHLAGVTPCEHQEVRLIAGAHDVRLVSRAASPEDGQLFVELELQWVDDDGDRVVEVAPSVLFAMSKPASVELDGPGGKVRVLVDGRGFPATPDARCLPSSGLTR
ncbi:MAG: hypothetical protein R3F61_20535 [Myxococcota bacterium]